MFNPHISANCVLTVQKQRNLDSRHRWELFAAHRQKVTQQLTQKSQSNQDRLCVLGTGNCNDLDMQRLLNAFDQIYLIDPDGDAVAAGIEQQNLSDCSKIHSYGGVDVTGIVEILAEWSHEFAPPEAAIYQCVQTTLQSSGLDIPGPFNVVASVMFAIAVK